MNKSLRYQRGHIDLSGFAWIFGGIVAFGIAMLAIGLWQLWVAYGQADTLIRGIVGGALTIVGGAVVALMLWLWLS